MGNSRSKFRVKKQLVCGRIMNTVIIARSENPEKKKGRLVNGVREKE